MTEHYYAWVRVGSGDPEPAAITGQKPNRKATTIGCPDTFNVDDQDSGCSIVLMASDTTSAMHGLAEEAVIETLEEDSSWDCCIEVSFIEAQRREIAYQLAVAIKPHSYAGFGRTAALRAIEQVRVKEVKRG